MKTILSYLAAGCVSALLGVSCAAAASFVNWNADESAEIQRSYRAALPINIDDYADGCVNPTFLFFTDGVIEEYEYDDVYCIKYSDEEIEQLGECEVYVDSISYKTIRETIASGRHTGGVIVPVGKAECGYRVYTYKPSPTL